MSLDYRKPWKPEEDQSISSLVQEFGLKKWAIIAQHLAERFNIKNRSGKQCRERWHNHLDSSIDKKPWTQEEDDLIFQLYKDYGKSWSKIAENIPGRTDNSVKNRFYSTLRRNLRKYNKSRPHSQRLIGSVRTILRNPNIPELLLQEQAPARLKKNKDKDNQEEFIENKSIIEDKSFEVKEKIETIEKDSGIELISPVPYQNLNSQQQLNLNFERFTKQIEDASLLYNLSQPELNYFYFYPQALSNYKDIHTYPAFINPVFPPLPYPMINSNPFMQQNNKKN